MLVHVCVSQCANLVVYQGGTTFETLETAAAMVQIVFGSACILSLLPKSTGQT